MSNPLVFATGNKSKFYEASTIAAKFSIELEQVKVAVDEIQHHEPIEITKAKVKAAWSQLQKPLVVNDSSWAIPALGGFPGGYMKDVTNWLSTEDFMNLMKDKDDRRMILSEVVAYYDGNTLNMFTHEREGFFHTEPKGESLPTFARLVEMHGENMTIAQVFDKGNWDTGSAERYKHWYDFYEWYVNRESVQ